MYKDKFEIHRGDITKLTVDAVVNAANQSLLGGGGVDGAIHRAAGPELLEACRKLDGCKTGSAKITKGYNLPAKYVIHAVGPVWSGGKRRENELLKSAYWKSLELAMNKGCHSVAFPCISTGVYHYPKVDAAKIAMDTINEFIGRFGQPEKIVFAVFGEEDHDIYKKLLAEYYI